MDEIVKALHAIQEQLSQGFWYKGDFWISSLISGVTGGFGIYYSVKAFKEARLAKDAAEDAALKAVNTVNAFSVVKELTDILHQLERLEENISYSSCKKLADGVSQKAIIALTPYEEDEKIKELIIEVNTSLANISLSLVAVIPTRNNSIGAPDTVYTAVVIPFGEFARHISALIGIFGTRTTAVRQP